MIRAFVEYSLRNRLLVMAVGIMLLAWGAISFKNLPRRSVPGRCQQLRPGHHPMARGAPVKKWNSRSQFRLKFR